MVFRADFPSPKIGEFDSELVEDFWQATAANALCNLHILVHYGRNSHHISEAIFKCDGPRAADGRRTRPADAGRAEHEGYARRLDSRGCMPRARLSPRQFFFVDVRLQEPRQFVEVAVRVDVPHHGHQRARVDQLLERHVSQLQLARRPIPSRRCSPFSTSAR